MKVVKYRCWNNKEKKMRKVVGLDFYEDKVEYLDDDKEIYHIKVSTKSVDLMQYIGIKDDNGKEIYEGDIIVNKQEDNIKIGIVNYDENRQRFVFSVVGKDMLNGGLNSYGSYYEVIGNIYENEALLKMRLD